MWEKEEMEAEDIFVLKTSVYSTLKLLIKLLQINPIIRWENLFFSLSAESCLEYECVWNVYVSPVFLKTPHKKERRKEEDLQR